MKEKRFPPAARMEDDSRILLVETEVQSGKDIQKKRDPGWICLKNLEGTNVVLFIVIFKHILSSFGNNNKLTR